MKLSELKGKLKVGMKVKEVREGTETDCIELCGGKVVPITEITKNGIRFNGCYHGWDDNIELDISSSWDNLSPGMILECGSYKVMVLEVGTSGKTFLISGLNDFDSAYTWYTITQVQKDGWKIVGETTKEYTIAELEDKLNMEKGSLRVKK